MFQEKIDNQYIVYQHGTSEGTQLKYYKDDYWYKKDSRGREGYAEYLASQLLTYSDLKSEEYVIYEQGLINEHYGCRSKNFLAMGEELVTLYRLYYNEFGKDLSQILNTIPTMEERIEYVISFVKQTCSYDITDYLKKVFTLDAIILNEDRHLNNLALIYTGSHFKAAPIFDNGVSFLTANQSFNRHLSIAENVKRVVARPFSGSHIKMCNYFGIGFHLDIHNALKWILDEPNSLEKDVLRYQLENSMLVSQLMRKH